VIYGGRSGEHEVSLASAASVIANLDRKRYEPVPIRIERDGRWTIPDRPPRSLPRRGRRPGA
jgi:D-alanine-D-alanine ligase